MFCAESGSTQGSVNRQMSWLEPECRKTGGNTGKDLERQAESEFNLTGRHALKEV